MVWREFHIRDGMVPWRTHWREQVRPSYKLWPLARQTFVTIFSSDLLKFFQSVLLSTLQQNKPILLNTLYKAFEKFLGTHHQIGPPLKTYETTPDSFFNHTYNSVMCQQIQKMCNNASKGCYLYDRLQAKVHVCSNFQGFEYW